MRSNPANQLFFIFQPENVLRSNLNFSTSYGRLTDLKSLLRLLLVIFIWVWEKNSLKYLFLGGGCLSSYDDYKSRDQNMNISRLRIQRFESLKNPQNPEIK